MIASDLASHLAIEHALEAFDAWVWDLSRWGQPVQATAACTSAQLALSAWLAYDGADASDWHGGRSTSKVADLLRLHIAEPEIHDGVALRSATERLAEELELMCAYVDEASGPALVCDRRERALAAARSIHSGGRATLWTPAMVPALDDATEYRARIAAGPSLETVDCCRMAVYAIGEPDGHSVVAAAIRQAIERRFISDSGPA
jgi:hypothetical protein